MTFRIWIALALTAALAGCASGPPSPLSLADAKSLRLDTVNVTVAPDAVVSWNVAEEELYKQKQAQGVLPKPRLIETGSLGLTGDPNATDNAVVARLAKSPEGKAFVNQKISDRLGTAIEQTLRPELQSGDRPVKLEITVHEFAVPSAGQRLLVGAWGGTPVIRASAMLKDSVTGQVLAERPNMTSAAFAGYGWVGVLADQLGDDLDVRLVNGYSNQYRDWLVPKKI
jgi:hypothetical protein